jgi:hypothetical protein
MSHTITVRIESDLAAWLERSATESGLSQGAIVREQLRKARESAKGTKSFMRLAGTIDGAKNLSQRKGFSRK